MTFSTGKIITTAAVATAVDTTSAQTLINKSISLGSNTITATKAQLNTAVTDGDVVYVGDTITAQNTTVAAATITNFLADSGASSNAPRMVLSRSKGASVGSYTIVAAADALGSYQFWGADGTTTVLSAAITSLAMGTPVAGDVRGNLLFRTGSGAGVTTIRLTIDDTNATFALPVTTSGCLTSGANTLTTGTLALAMATKPNVTVTPNATGTFTSTVPPAGTICTLEIVTSGTTSYTMTFGTGFKTTGTLATGTVTAKTFMLAFLSNGTTLNELSRTAAM